MAFRTRQVRPLTIAMGTVIFFGRDDCTRQYVESREGHRGCAWCHGFDILRPVLLRPVPLRTCRPDPELPSVIVIVIEFCAQNLIFIASISSRFILSLVFPLFSLFSIVFCFLFSLFVFIMFFFSSFFTFTSFLQFHTTAREPKRAHLRVPAFQITTKIPREDPQRHKKNANGSEKGKKRAKFWASGAGGLGELSAHTDTQTHNHTTHADTTLAQNGLVQIGLAKVGHDRRRQETRTMTS